MSGQMEGYKTMHDHFFVSQNSRYILSVEGSDMTLNREEREIWKKTISYSDFEILGVYDNGNVVIRSESGILVLPPDPGKGGELISVFSREALAADGALLGKIAVDENGENLCVEMTSQKSKLSEKLISMLASAPEIQKGQEVHEIMLYNLRTGKRTLLYRFPSDFGTPHAFSWEISHNFKYVLWAEVQKKSKGPETMFSLADLTLDAIQDQFVIHGAAAWDIKMHNSGASLIDSPREDDPREVLLRSSGGTKQKITLPRGSKAEHLGADYVAIRNEAFPLIIFKRFDNTVIEEVDLSPMEEMKMEYQTFFNQAGDVDFVVRKSGMLKVIHSSVDRLSIEARRWRMMVEQQKIEAETAMRRGEMEAMEHSMKEMQSKKRTEDLMKEVLELTESRFKEEEKKRVPIDPIVPPWEKVETDAAQTASPSPVTLKSPPPKKIEYENAFDDESGFALSSEDEKNGSGEYLDVGKRLELEIEQIVQKKRELLEKADRIKENFKGLLDDLDEKFRAGGISKESYLMTRKHFEERLQVVDKEFRL